MKKTSFVIAILASALLAGACGKKKDAAAPTPPAETTAPAEGTGDPAAPAEGTGDPAAPPAEGSGSSM